MDIGFFLYTTDYTIGVVELAPMLAERGFESLWLPDHSHIPAERESVWMGHSHPEEPSDGDSLELPDFYANMLDPFVAMAAAGVAAPGLKVATGVSLVNQRHPITLAKEVMTLEAILGPGRLILGVGAGWNVEEMRNHAVDPDRRWLRVRETVEAARAIWTEDRAEYHGDIIDFGPIASYPKPQQPGPPILIGGAGEKVFSRINAYADGWVPVVNRGAKPDWADVAAGVERLAATSQGQDRKMVTVMDMRPTPEALQRCRDMGVDRYVIGFAPVDRNTVIEHLDFWAPKINGS